MIDNINEISLQQNASLKRSNADILLASTHDVSSFKQRSIFEIFPYFSYMDGLVLSLIHPICHHLSHTIASESHVHSWEQIEQG
jgi:hypothetical protein